MLVLHDVEVLFGLCGDTSLPFSDALRQVDPRIKHVLCRDERSAGYMADGYARVTGKVGVCEGPSGGGATYILPGAARGARTGERMGRLGGLTDNREVQHWRQS
jgi:acetolactate synthase-1/2/3 large subunit